MKSLMSLMIVLAVAGAASAGVVDFDDLTLAADSYWNGSDESGGFTSGSASFNNNYNTDSSSWGGWAYSSKIDTATPGFGNQYSTYAGQAQSGTNFAVGYQDAYNGVNPTMIYDVATQISGLYVTNTTYTALDMLHGSGYSKKFGGTTGNDQDWFLLTITGLDTVGSFIGKVEFYLADYRFADNSQDYILDTWKSVDLSSLGSVSTLEFALTSSDVGGWGMNTPAYFAMDTVIPEPMTLALLGLGGLLLRKRK